MSSSDPSMASSPTGSGGDVMVRQQNVLWTQLKSFQLGQCAIDGILQLADVAGPAASG
ncbi:hypothetical protein LNP24_13395 [Klebsiella pneumoniae subsp. pneumoniae]|nr:hypothetical protein [Klebsiella pneumoniae subsp. pneumoniae]